MHARTNLALTPLFAALVSTLPTRTASAQEEEAVHPAEKALESREREGVALEAGGLFAPGAANIGTLGLQTQAGVQLNDELGFVGTSTMAVLSDALVDERRARGIQLGGALMVDVTLLHVLTLGIGPDLSIFPAVDTGRLSAELLYGGRLHLAVNPFVLITGREGRRQAFTIGIDLRLYASAGAAVVWPDGAAANEAVVSPSLTIGYQTF